MTRSIAAVLLFASVVSIDLAAQTRRPVSVRLGNISSDLQSEPYKAGHKVKVPAMASPIPTGRTKDGLVVSCFSVYGWRSGDSIAVVVLMGIPADGKENRFYDPASGDNWFADLQFRELARYTLVVGQTHLIDEMKSVGIAPMRLQVTD